jgi:hypothetical protein
MLNKEHMEKLLEKKKIQMTMSTWLNHISISNTSSIMSWWYYWSIVWRFSEEDGIKFKGAKKLIEHVLIKV